MLILVLILAVPFFGAVLHDSYLNFILEEEKLMELLSLEMRPEDFKFTDLGWVIERYTPSVLDTMRSLFSQDSWKEWILPLLKEPTILVTAYPFGIAFSIWFVIFAVKTGQKVAKASSKKPKDFKVYDYSKKDAMKYKRK